MRALLNELREMAAEVQEAQREFLDNAESLGWKSAGESMGVRVEWREDDKDGSLWVRMDGEIEQAPLTLAAAVAHEAELWPKWVPFCTAAETLKAISPTEIVTYIQFDLATSVMKRGAVLHWTLSDSLVERQSLLLLGASLDESSPIEKPPSAASVSLCDVRCLKALITPRTKASARVQWVLNVDLKAPSKMPSALVTMVTKKITGAILPLIGREAQKLGAIRADADSAAAADNAYLRKMDERGGDGFYEQVNGLIERYFEMFGEEEDEDEDKGEDDSQDDD